MLNQRLQKNRETTTSMARRLHISKTVPENHVINIEKQKIKKVRYMENVEDDPTEIK